MNAPLTTSAERRAFRLEGVVALRDAFEPRWIETLRTGIEANIANPTENFTNHTTDPSAPAYLEDFWAWNRFDEFRDFVHNSPCAAIAAELLGAKRIHLVMDNWFLRQAGSASRAPFHHDISYFDFHGSMCVLWLPLTPVGAAECLAWVRGSHAWGKLFRRVFFRDGHEGGETPCIVNGLEYEPPPDVAADPSRYDLARFDLAPGDCVYFDMRTVHGSLPDDSPPARDGMRYSLRMAAENGIIGYRGDWARHERAIMAAAGYGDGDAIAGDFFPCLWEREPAAATGQGVSP